MLAQRAHHARMKIPSQIRDLGLEPNARMKIDPRSNARVGEPVVRARWLSAGPRGEFPES